jgi:hypothetical protein
MFVQVNCTDDYSTIPNTLPVGSVDGKRPYALSSGQAHFHLTRTKQPFLESAETFHDGPEQLYRARALHVESEGPDGQISPPVVNRVGKRRASNQSGQLHGVCTRFDAKTSFGCKNKPVSPHLLVQMDGNVATSDDRRRDVRWRVSICGL